MVVLIGGAGEGDLLDAFLAVVGCLATVEGDEGYGVGEAEAVLDLAEVVLADMGTVEEAPPGVVIGEDDGPLLHVEYIAAKGVEGVFDVLLEGVGSGEDGDDTEDADHDTREREEGAQARGEELLYGEAERLEEYLEEYHGWGKGRKKGGP